MRNPRVSNVVLRAALGLALLAASTVHAQDPPAAANFTVNTVADQIDDNLGDGVCHTGANAWRGP